MKVIDRDVENAAELSGINEPQGKCSFRSGLVQVDGPFQRIGLAASPLIAGAGEEIGDVGRRSIRSNSDCLVWVRGDDLLVILWGILKLRALSVKGTNRS